MVPLGRRLGIQLRNAELKNVRRTARRRLGLRTNRGRPSEAAIAFGLSMRIGHQRFAVSGAFRRLEFKASPQHFSRRATNEKRVFSYASDLSPCQTGLTACSNGRIAFYASANA